MTPEAFRWLPTDQQAEMIAAYRVWHQIEAIQDYEHWRAMKRASKAK